MITNYLSYVIDHNLNNEALVWENNFYTYEWLKNRTEYWIQELAKKNIIQGSVVAIQGDFSPNTVSLLIALIKNHCIIVPIAMKNKIKNDEYYRIAQVEYVFEFDAKDNAVFSRKSETVENALLSQLQQKKHPGLVIFSSGSTGKCKAAVHDLLPLIENFAKPKKRTRVIAFLLFDHIGGLNTLFYTLFNAGCLITIKARTPRDVCESIERFKAEALTTTPTFLNLLLLSGIIPHYDLGSLSIVNYGTEIMSELTLKKLNSLFSRVRFSQAYGLTELGVLPVRSRSSNSLFIKIDGDGFQTRIVDGLLEVKSNSSMLGYLNAPNPFTEDGWFKTGDAVEVDGKYLRVLGRKSELINVGGEKVYPAEIEGVIHQIQGVEQASVFSESNAITGQIVVARIKLRSSEHISQFRIRLHEFCRTRLPAYKIPQKIILTNSTLHNERFKTIRY